MRRSSAGAGTCPPPLLIVSADTTSRSETRASEGGGGRRLLVEDVHNRIPQLFPWRAGRALAANARARLTPACGPHGAHAHSTGAPCPKMATGTAYAIFGQGAPVAIFGPGHLSPKWARAPIADIAFTCTGPVAERASVSVPDPNGRPPWAFLAHRDAPSPAAR